MIAFLSIAVICCAPQKESSRAEKSGDVVEIDSCNTCVIDAFFVKQMSAPTGKKITIREAVAVQFFNQVRLAHKYVKSVPYDTLAKVLKVEDIRYMQAVYTLHDQYSYFEGVLKPILIENSIELMDSVSLDHLLEFQASNRSFVVNPKDYQYQDGVLFFTPEKEPMFWTVKGEINYCKRNYDGFIITQYFLCPTGSKADDK